VRALRSKGSHNPQAGPSIRVLIVDDAPCFRGVVRELLERRGYTVAGEADCAAAAIEAAARLAPDAVLLDVQLPDGNGFDVSARLTRTDPAPAVLLVSADEDLDCCAHLERSGARGFVPKSQLAHAELARFWPGA
jgi:DNA-binding NarL/FixJ family response regulator